MPICVYSETGPLKRVLLHRPGKELEHLVPGSLDRLLFDDIPYLAGAQQEHDRFAALLRENGVEVSYLSELMEQTLRAEPALREPFVDEFIAAGGDTARFHARALRAYLLSLGSERELVEKTMAGVRMQDIAPARTDSLSALLHRAAQFVLDPIPNLYFTRDPFASIGRGASLHRMYAQTRRRECIYGSYILRRHPDFAGSVPLYYTPDEPFSLEGGDILNLSSRLLAVGASQRTSPEAIERLAQRLFADPECPVETLLVMDIPGMRAYMHLDTVFTQLDADKFIIHPAILPTLRLFVLERGAGGAVGVRALDEPLEPVLERLLGLESVTLIRCGGADFIAAQREQWNDGSNTLCIAPGRVVTYDRNYVTNELLDKNGVEVLAIPAGELSRGRGGPRCMSMPLVRGAL